MEETLTDCTFRVKEDLIHLNKVREYLDRNAETDGNCSFTWRTIEAFNSILSVCSSQNPPETNALDTLLDSFYFLARNNTDNSVWENFGFELGIICVKILSAIERTEIFELLFCKLLSIICMICEHNLNVWKAAARQILNVLINKKFSFSYLEAILKWYLCIIQNIKTYELYDFSLQNLHLLKTLSLLVQKVGDFEIQMDIIRMIFLHLSKDTKLMKDFFTPSEKKLFQSFQFNDFEGDCRLYLNNLNESRKGCERKVYSIPCLMLYLGGCYIEPPIGRSLVWVDVNADTERLSIKCCDSERTGDRVIYIQFSEILNVCLENEKTQVNPCVSIQTKSLVGLHKQVKSDNICLVTENKKVKEFVEFLGSAIREFKKKKKLGMKMSRTIDSLFIDREVQDNMITSSEKPKSDDILCDVFTLFENTSQKEIIGSDFQFKTSQKTHGHQLSPGSFVESLNKHIGSNSPELKNSFEDSVEAVEFFRKTTPRKTHKLFRSPDEMFKILEPKESNNFVFDEDKENEKSSEKLTRRPSLTPTPNAFSKVLRDRENLEKKISNTESQDYFQRNSNLKKKKKPSLPKLKKKTRKRENVISDVTNPQKYKNPKTETEIKTKNLEKPRAEPRSRGSIEGEKEKFENETEVEKDKLEGEVVPEFEKDVEPHTDNQKYQAFTELMKKSPENYQYEKVFNDKPVGLQNKTKQNEKAEKNSKPSLLDPNGYTYQRWCKPTTSDRSNFWLKKLEGNLKSKPDADVFDFIDETDSIVEKCKKKKKKKRIINSKRKPKTLNETKQTSLREVKKILKISPLKEKIPAPPRTPQQVHQSPAADNQPAKLELNPEYESWESSEDDEPITQTKKREHSEEENSSCKGCTKKKLKSTLPTNLLSSIRRRLQKTEEKNKHQTNEIVQVIIKATNHLLNHLHRKDGEKIVSYLKTAETVSFAFESETTELNLRAKRIQRALLYYKAGCSVADFCHSLDNHFSSVKKALQELKEKKDFLKTIDRINDRLSNLINSEIEKSIKNEWTLKREKLLRCASVLGIDFGEYD